MIAAIALSLLSQAAPARSGHVCTQSASGGTCYGYLGGPESARFQSYDWGHEVFLATYAGQSYHCTAVDPEVFARAAATSDFIRVTWDRYHRCIEIALN